MSQSHEPSYYEIALTNRQVLIVFVVLLICVVVAFFSGVWVGQRDAPGVVEEVARTQEALANAGEEEGAAVGELHFFADREAAERQEPASADLAERSQEPTTLAEDLGAAEPETTPEPPAAAQPAREEATRPQPELSAAAYVIQVFSSSDETQARRLLEELNKGGYPAFLSPVEVGNQTMMRVRIGPYAELASAESVAEKVRREFKLDTWVTH